MTARVKITFLSLFLALIFCFTSALAASPNDPLFGEQWGLQAMGFQSAWDTSSGSGATVAILDSGVAWGISDFSGTSFDRGGSYDFWEGDSDPSNDGNGHGTNIAGTIAQTTNNGNGAAGAAYGSTILSIRVAGDEGEFVSDDVLADAINYAVSHGADIINMSFGGGGGNSALESACQNAYNSGVLLVAAAGNSGGGGLDIPASYGSVLAVGAVESNLSLAGYSSHSQDMVVAPGDSLQQTPSGGYTSYSGTSMATAHVSGAAAVILSEGIATGAAPGKSASRVDWLVDIIRSTAQDLGSSGADSTYGYGLVRVDSALNALN